MSEDIGTKDKGGDVGFFTREGMELPFAKAAFEAQNLGELIGPVTTIYGYHLLKVTGRTPGNERWQDSVRGSHILAMFANKTQVMNFVARADAGNVDLGFVDAGYRDFAPEAFRK
jgi:parvulin-like peptidyl-prolyl isomerase